MNEHKRSFTWVVHARLEGTREKRDDKINFTACMSLVGDANQPKLPTAIDPQKKGLRATVEVIQLGASHRFVCDQKSNLHYARGIALKRETSGGAHLRDLGPGRDSFEETSQLWRAVGDTVRFKRPGNRTPDLPHARRVRTDLTCRSG